MTHHTTRRLPGKSLEEKFWAYTAVTLFTDCWLWHGPNDCDQGYGRLYTARHKYIYAHRFSYELHNGPLSDDLDVCHTCDNPRCVNPCHLFAGTHQDNMDDMIAKGRLVQPHVVGEAQGNAKLTTADVLQIRALYDNGMLQREIAERFDINRGTVSKIVLRQRWKHI